MFRFQGRAGDQVVAEVSARRLNSPLGSVLKLTDAAGRQLALNDDHDDKGAGPVTHQADSLLRVALPADDTYDVRLGDAQHSGGPEYAYRLRISPPQPDFALRIVPSSVNIRGGATVPLSVYALRQDGFSGDIALAFTNAPAGLTLGGAWVPAGQDQVRITVTAPPTSRKEPLSLGMEGRATIEGREVVHPAVPAEDMMQAFAYRHLVPANELKLSVWQGAATQPAGAILGAAPIKIPAGGTARYKVQSPTAKPQGEIQLELDDPPEGVTLRSEPQGPEGPAIVLQSDAAKVKPGLKGNLILHVFAVTGQESGKKKPQAARRRTPLGILPALPSRS